MGFLTILNESFIFLPKSIYLSKKRFLIRCGLPFERNTSLYNFLAS